MMMRWMGLFVIALMGVGCTIEGIEEGEELQADAPGAQSAEEDTEEIAEVSQALVLKSYSAPLTSHQKVQIVGTLVFRKGAGAQRGEAKAWAAKEDAKGHTCACGCGGRIRVTSRQFKTGVPKYLRAHHFGQHGSIA